MTDGPTGPGAIAARAAALLGGEAAQWRALSGGDLSAVVWVALADGREAVAKGGPDPVAEAGMLAAIRDAGAPAPEPLAADRDVLVMEALPEGGGGSDAALGEAVATLHAAIGEGYGWEADYAFAHVAVPNAPAPDWPAFWAERRLRPALPDLPPPLARRVEGLAAALPDRLPAHPPAALLHGDLWGGNVHRAAGRVWLIDPACFRGDAEVDLAMLTLFGRPGPEFAAAYGPLAPGWEARRPIYQLWPALNHLRLFGAGWRGLVEGLLDAAGA